MTRESPEPRSPRSRSRRGAVSKTTSAGPPLRTRRRSGKSTADKSAPGPEVAETTKSTASPTATAAPDHHVSGGAPAGADAADAGRAAAASVSPGHGDIAADIDPGPTLDENLQCASSPVASDDNDDLVALRVERLAALGCTPEEIAGIVGCDVRSLLEQHRRTYERGRAAGRAGLRRLLWKAAGEGKVTILIWLSRQWFGGESEDEECAMADSWRANDGAPDDEDQPGGRAATGAPGHPPRLLQASDLLERPIIIERHILPGAADPLTGSADTGREKPDSEAEKSEAPESRS